MPILTQEVAVSPEDLFEGHGWEIEDRRWYAIYTKPRQEKALARELVPYEVPFFLPLTPKDKLVRGHRRRSYLPLFNGYLFVCANEPERLRCLRTNRVSTILQVAEQETLVRDLCNLHRLIELDAPLTLETQFSPGRRVRISSGPLQGIEGQVTQVRGHDRLLVAVDFLQQGASIEIDNFLLGGVN